MRYLLRVMVLCCSSSGKDVSSGSKTRIEETERKKRDVIQGMGYQSVQT